MNTTKYTVLEKVVELGSLTKAGKLLGYTQSGISHVINSLEEELGFAVLMRSRAGVRLTSEGERVMPAIRAILSANEQLNQIVASIHGVEAGTIRIGTFTSVAVHWLPGMIKAFQKDYPNIEFVLKNGDYYDVENWLAGNHVDLGFVNFPKSDRYDCIPLVEDRVLCILPKDHPSANLPVFPLKEIEKEPFISLLEESAHDMRHALENTGVKPHIKFTTKDDYAIIAMVEQGLGISIMPELVIRDRTRDICVKELENYPRRVIGLALPSAETPSPAVLQFIAYIKKWILQHVPAGVLMKEESAE